MEPNKPQITKRRKSKIRISEAHNLSRGENKELIVIERKWAKRRKIFGYEFMKNRSTNRNAIL